MACSAGTDSRRARTAINHVLIDRYTPAPLYCGRIPYYPEESVVKELSKKKRLKLISSFEQTVAGLEAGDPVAEAKARHFLADNAENGSRSTLLMFMRGCLKVLDEMQGGIDDDLQDGP
jgi:hypothetical protein